MKIAVSSTEENIESKIDQRFGRCEYFIIADIEDGEIKETKAVKNEGAIQGHGAGIKAAQQLGELKVEAIITGNLGPNATKILDQLNIESYHGEGKAKENIIKFLNQDLPKIDEISEPHHDTQSKTNEKIFFPLLKDKGMDSTISDHFGHAPYFGIYDRKTESLSIIENKLDHTDASKSPIDQIEEKVNPSTIFAKGIGGRAIRLIQEKGICLKTGPFDTVKEAIKNIDKLDDQTESCGH